MVIHPDNIWYHSCTPDVIEKIIKYHLLQNSIVNEFLLSKPYISQEDIQNQPKIKTILNYYN